MLHEMVEKYLWLSFGVNVYVNVTFDDGCKISMALFWSKCLCECHMRWMVEKYLWLSLGVNVYVNVTWDGWKRINGKCLCECYMRWLKKNIQYMANVYVNVSYMRWLKKNI
jgi:predicted RNA-binding protein (virulence factor B family)